MSINSGRNRVSIFYIRSKKDLCIEEIYEDLRKMTNFIDNHDTDEKYKNCTDLVNTKESKINNLKNKTLNEVHGHILDNISKNNGTEFFIYKN